MGLLLRVTACVRVCLPCVTLYKTRSVTSSKTPSNFLSFRRHVFAVLNRKVAMQERKLHTKVSY